MRKPSTKVSGKASRKLPKLSHYGKGSAVNMVDVTAKDVASREATARGFVRIARPTLAQVRRHKTPKGDPLEIARIAGIAAAKRTAEWIPLCHPLPLTHIDVTATLCKDGVEIASRVRATARTGVEMEALVASAAALTVYDMCKALDPGIEITDIYLLEKTGGKRGIYRRRARLRLDDAVMTTASKSVRVLVVDDNPLVRDLMCKSLEPLCEVTSAGDGADGLLKAVDSPPDLIITDYRMGGLDGRKLYEKLRGREATRNIPFIFVASRGDIEEKLRQLVAAEDFLPKPFFVADLVRLAKRVIDRVHLEKMQQHASRPGVISGRLEEMGVAELMQSLEMGGKTCRLTLRHGGESCELYFAAGACKDARMGAIEGDEVVYRAVNWTDGEFEIEFGAVSDRTTTTRSTTGLLMEAMRLMDEATSDSVPK